jgi:hypothetical protein
LDERIDETRPTIPVSNIDSVNIGRSGQLFVREPFEDLALRWERRGHEVAS